MMEENAIRTGFSAIDDITGGFKPSELVVIAGRPGMRKNAFAISIAKNIAVDEKIPTAFFKLEMANTNFVSRLISNVCNIDGSIILNGQLNREEWDRLAQNVNMLFDSPLYLDDSPKLTLGDIENRIREYVDEHGVKMVIIDYVGLINVPNVRDSRKELAIALDALKKIAVDMNIVIIAVANLYYGEEKPEIREPFLDDHDEFKTIGELADWSLFIYRPELYRNRETESNTCRIVISNDGETPIGTVNLKYQWGTRRFDNTEIDPNNNGNE
jgi:replicative DNA helicase